MAEVWDLIRIPTVVQSRQSHRTQMNICLVVNEGIIVKVSLPHLIQIVVRAETYHKVVVGGIGLEAEKVSEGGQSVEAAVIVTGQAVETRPMEVISTVPVRCTVIDPKAQGGQVALEVVVRLDKVPARIGPINLAAAVKVREAIAAEKAKEVGEVGKGLFVVEAVGKVVARVGSKAMIVIGVGSMEGSQVDAAPVIAMNMTAICQCLHQYLKFYGFLL